MKENSFANLKHLVAFWDETGRTKIIPIVKVVKHQSGHLIGLTAVKEILPDEERCLCTGIPFTCGQDIKEGDILHNVEAFELKLRDSKDTTTWRLRIKSNQYDG